jgi:NTP pyrophosphatase (non-canonical NTP hydrolase)
MSKTLEELEANVTQWAIDRGLLGGRKALDWDAAARQMLKLTEEVGEIAAGVAKRREKAAWDGIGDAMVVLTILARQLDVSLADCYALAWEEIKDRAGVTVGGVFIRDESGAA